MKRNTVFLIKRDIHQAIKSQFARNDSKLLGNVSHKTDPDPDLDPGTDTVA